MTAGWGYFAIIVLPLLYTEVPSLVVYRWYWFHKRAPMPTSVEQQAAREARIAPFVAVPTLVLSVCCLIWWTGLSLASIGVSSVDWIQATVVGVTAGLCWLAGYVFLLSVFPPRKEQLGEHVLLQHSVQSWIPLGVASAIVEEVWRAFCLIALGDQAPVIGVAATSVAAGWAHWHPPARAVSATMFGVYSAKLFLWTQSLWTTIPAHEIVNLATLTLDEALASWLCAPGSRKQFLVASLS
jgi:hypothetical protein